MIGDADGNADVTSQAFVMFPKIPPTCLSGVFPSSLEAKAFLFSLEGKFYLGFTFDTDADPLDWPVKHETPMQGADLS